MMKDVSDKEIKSFTSIGVHSFEEVIKGFSWHPFKIFEFSLSFLDLFIL